jgi:hypothetical protein
MAAVADEAAGADEVVVVVALEWAEVVVPAWVAAACRGHRPRWVDRRRSVGLRRRRVRPARPHDPPSALGPAVRDRQRDRPLALRPVAGREPLISHAPQPGQVAEPRALFLEHVLPSARDRASANCLLAALVPAAQASAAQAPAAQKSAGRA